jgi:hypothetical protein
MTGPLRDSIGEATSQIPTGPLGFLGGGNTLGLTGMIIAGGSSVAIPGDEFDPGYQVRGEEVVDRGDAKEHKFTIDAYSRNVAEVVAKVRSAPSNVDLFTHQTEIVDSQEMTERRTASTWQVTVEVRDKSILNND